jgi:phage terminase large subunit-like protein
MTATYGGSRIGRQELDGELMAEAEGSLPFAKMEGAAHRFGRGGQG